MSEEEYEINSIDKTKRIDLLLINKYIEDYINNLIKSTKPIKKEKYKIQEGNYKVKLTIKYIE